MVPLSTILADNEALPERLTAVFVGGTSGIGRYTCLALAKHCAHPTIHIIGRSQASASTLLTSLKALNPHGTYTFHALSGALLSAIDTLCTSLLAALPALNILFLSQGTLATGEITSEGLHVPAALVLHSRHRFTLNLLPALERAHGVKRVVSVFVGTKEGAIAQEVSDLQMREVRDLKGVRGVAGSAVTVLMEEAEGRARGVSFVHTFPGFVDTGIARDLPLPARVFGTVFKTLARPFLFIPTEESGERNLWLATAERFCARGHAACKEPAVGTDGKAGSGVYTVDEKGECGGEDVIAVLRGVKEEGRAEWVCGEVRRDFIRITGRESLHG